jgi:hypothetical protein
VTTPLSFVQTLEEKLSQAAAARSGQAGTEAEVATQAFWGTPLFTPRPGAPAWVYGTSPARGSFIPVGRQPPEVRAAPVRRLTAAQRNALRLLRRLGAIDLDPGFSDRQLRRAFRTLAKRFHPDRHPASSATEKEGLAWTFASVCTAYRDLATASS